MIEINGIAHIQITAGRYDIARAFYMQLLDCTVLNNGNPGLLWRPIDQNVLLHRLRLSKVRSNVES